MISLIFISHFKYLFYVTKPILLFSQCEYWIPNTPISCLIKYLYFFSDGTYNRYTFSAHAHKRQFVYTGGLLPFWPLHWLPEATKSSSLSGSVTAVLYIRYLQYAWEGIWKPNTVIVYKPGGPINAIVH